jgi:hypothetical protein
MRAADIFADDIENAVPGLCVPFRVFHAARRASEWDVSVSHLVAWGSKQFALVSWVKRTLE